MTNLVLVRHGETIWSGDNRYAGASDIALTPLGVQQAERLARWARWAKLSALWCSPLTRARDTAAAVEKHTGLKRRIDPRLRELDFGRGEGKTNDEMKQQLGNAYEKWKADPYGSPLPGGEEPRESVDRIIACFNEIEMKHRDQRVIVVGHATVFRLALCRLMGIPEKRYRDVFPMMLNAAVTEITYEPDSVGLLQYNVTVQKTDE